VNNLEIDVSSRTVGRNGAKLDLAPRKLDEPLEKRLLQTVHGAGLMLRE